MPAGHPALLSRQVPSLDVQHPQRLCVLGPGIGVSASALGACPAHGACARSLRVVPALRGAFGVRDTVQLAGWLCACAHPSCSWRLTPRADPDDGRACGGTRSSRGHTESAFLCVITPLPRLTHHPSQSRGQSCRPRHFCLRMQKMRELQDLRWTGTYACEMHRFPRSCREASDRPYRPRL